jgi:hypothetical protein
MKIRTLIFMGLAAVIFASCNRQEVPVRDSNEISLNVLLPGATKVTATSFEQGDKISLFAVEYNGEEALPLQIGGNYLNNEKVTFDGTKWVGEEKLYWSNKPCDFYALYPYQDFTSIDSQIIDLALDQNPAGAYEASDLLYAKTTNVTRADGSVNLRFGHMMAKCVVNVIKGSNYEGDFPDDIVAHVYNTVTSAKINMVSGGIEKYAYGEHKTITMKKISKERFEAIVIPQNVERRTPLIEITMDGIAYLLESSVSFKPGYINTFNVTVNTSPTQEKIEISIDASIDDWN